MECFAAYLFRSFPVQAVGRESSEHSSARNILWDGSGMDKAEDMALSILFFMSGMGIAQMYVYIY